MGRKKKDKLSGFYNQDFFNLIIPDALKSAEVIVPLVIDLVHPCSVVDVGCGTGVWLSVFKKGVISVLGIDGPYISRSSLAIDDKEFISKNLSDSISLPDTYDLAICLEVAEHIPKRLARKLVDSLSRLSSVILFSAATPGQSGRHHVNEQWPNYWEKLFREVNYIATDPIRPLIWQNPDVAWFYRQNCFLFVKKNLIETNDVYRHLGETHAQNGLFLVHRNVLNKNLGLIHSIKRIPASCKSAFLYYLKVILRLGNE